jgi:hypothetical protein
VRHRANEVLDERQSARDAPPPARQGGGARSVEDAPRAHGGLASRCATVAIHSTWRPGIGAPGGGLPTSCTSAGRALLGCEPPERLRQLPHSGQLRRSPPRSGGTAGTRVGRRRGPLVGRQARPPMRRQGLQSRDAKRPQRVGNRAGGWDITAPAGPTAGCQLAHLPPTVPVPRESDAGRSRCSAAGLPRSGRQILVARPCHRGRGW